MLNEKENKYKEFIATIIATLFYLILSPLGLILLFFAISLIKI